jgi:hypothetical protein
MGGFEQPILEVVMVVWLHRLGQDEPVYRTFPNIFTGSVYSDMC